MKNKNVTSVYINNENIEKLKKLKIQLLEHSFETNTKAISLSALFNMFLEEVLDNHEMLERLINKYCSSTVSGE